MEGSSQYLKDMVNDAQVGASEELERLKTQFGHLNQTFVENFESLKKEASSGREAAHKNYTDGKNKLTEVYENEKNNIMKKVEFNSEKLQAHMEEASKKHALEENAYENACNELNKKKDETMKTAEKAYNDGMAKLEKIYDEAKK